MKAVVTRVTSASVTIGGEVCGQIGRGFLVLLGVGPNDTEAQAARLADKVTGLRVFEDENEKMNRNRAAVGGGLLVVSQFTLYADTKSRRPGFTGQGDCIFSKIKSFLFCFSFELITHLISFPDT